MANEKKSGKKRSPSVWFPLQQRSSIYESAFSSSTEKWWQESEFPSPPTTPLIRHNFTLNEIFLRRIRLCERLCKFFIEFRCFYGRIVRAFESFSRAFLKNFRTEYFASQGRSSMTPQNFGFHSLIWMMALRTKLFESFLRDLLKIFLHAD